MRWLGLLSDDCCYSPGHGVGGAVASFLAAERVFTGPLILFAPATSAITRLVYGGNFSFPESLFKAPEESASLLPSPRVPLETFKALIVHGRYDGKVSVQDSKLLQAHHASQSGRVALKVVDDDHSLASTITSAWLLSLLLAVTESTEIRETQLSYR